MTESAENARAERAADRAARRAVERAVGRDAQSESTARSASAVLDAVAVIALMSLGHSWHGEARAALHQFDGMLKLIHPINLAEVLVKPAGDGAADKAQAALADAGIVTFTTRPGDPLVLARGRATTRLKMPDVCAYATARANGLPLVTFDRKLTIAARASGVTVLGAPLEWQP